MRRVTSGGAYLRGLAPKQHSSEETSQRWRAVDDTVYDLTVPGIKPQTSRPDRDTLITELTGRFVSNQCKFSIWLLLFVKFHRSKTQHSYLVTYVPFLKQL